MEGRLHCDGRDIAAIVTRVEAWRAAGATHLSVNTMGFGLGPVDGHLRVLESLAGAINLMGSRQTQ
jgi:hypothetical protein